MSPLQIVNDKQLNTRSNANVHTPVKQHAKRPDLERGHHDYNRQPPQKRKKEKLSALCKTPPSLIKTKGRDYHRGIFLGEGGFARCFQMKDDSGKIFAAKTVAKISIKSEKTRKKLLSEIQIHKSMKHPNIVQFTDCFEDDTNVYILLEICPNGSLMDLLKQRKQLTEPEVRYFTTQIVGAIRYMHSRRIIHRDLKLGNIFFDKHFNLKIGDFGLAAVLANDRERKYTICGTPNYIAPEVLTGKHTGHSFEVDIWSIGVMIYALLIGKPPFQSKEVNTIYERIKVCDFSFPKEKPISSEARVLIKDILSLDPLERPSLAEIMEYVWFRNVFPARINSGVLSFVPEYHDLDLQESLINFKNCMAKCGLLSPSAAAAALAAASAVKPSIDPVTGEIATATASTATAVAFNNNHNVLFSRNNSDNSEYNKAVLPHSLSPGGTRYKYKEIVDVETQRKLNDLAREARIRRAQQSVLKQSLVASSTNFIKSEISLRILASECHMTLNGLLEAEAQKRMGGLPKSRLPEIQHPIVVTKWVDYSNKHGFAYQLSTDDIGVLFNNGTTVLKLADAEEFWYISYDDREGWVANHYSLTEKPKELNRHLEVVDFFSNYMNSNLSRISTFVRESYHKDDVFLRRFTRYKQFVMFELSDGTFQFNFKDHHKFAISQSGKLATYISPDRQSFTYPTIEILKAEKVPSHPEVGFMEKFMLMKEGLKQKSGIVSVAQQ
ncbi:HCL006Wp [Eremothecium sinecaudum]|uniref:Serine/threonine-protein kinase n=1 Tax=Eremothecium sinecaudum TaxID=45286 RepID=A0A120K220_9SACH|nr:HCL006Wp [Eremothecium sinecaudum]AMD20145.1 HCL006Wp [Eremothecium sinecaudum]